MIERILFFFKDEDNKLLNLNESYYPISVLLNRLINEVYSGKKIKFLNIYFSTEKTYELFPNSPRYYVHYYRGHLWYNDVFDLDKFKRLTSEEKKLFVWNGSYEALKRISVHTKNQDLLNAVEYAYKKGKELKLNPDYEVVKSNINLYGEEIHASLWINFRDDGMYSKLTLKKNNRILFEKHIDRVKNGVEFFLVMYKGIQVENNSVVITGRKDVEYLPLKIPIEKSLVLH